MRKPFLIIAGLTLLASCAATDRNPIVDMAGVNTAQFNNDMAQCQSYADEVETGREVARGSVGGAVVGGLIGAVVGNSDVAQRTAGAGAVAGGARGAGRSMRERDIVLRNCLRGRGYRVLN